MAITISTATDRFFTYEVPDRDAQVDMFVYKTRSERNYVENLGPLTNSKLERWYGHSILDLDAYKIPKALIYVNFRFIKKGQYWYWREEVRQERRLPSSHVWLLPWHIQHQGAIKHSHNNSVLLRVPEGWAQYEVARNCNVELPSVLTYKTGRLLDRRNVGTVPVGGSWLTLNMRQRTLICNMVDIFKKSIFLRHKHIYIC